MSETDDRQQIIDQLNRLAAAFDARDWDAVGDVMVPEVRAYGCDGLDAVVRDSLRRHLGGCGPSQHLLGNHQIHLDGDRATSITKARVFHLGAGERAGRTFECFGDYHDAWIRTPTGWRMTEREFATTIVLGDFDVLQPG